MKTDYLNPTEPPIIAPGVVIDNCGRTLLPLDTAFLCMANPMFGCFYMIVTVRKVSEKVTIELNEAGMDVFMQLGLSGLRFIEILPDRLLRLPAGGPELIELKKLALEVMATCRLRLDRKGLLDL